MKPLNKFTEKKEAIEYYIKNNIMTYEEANEYIEKYWDRVR